MFSYPEAGKVCVFFMLMAYLNYEIKHTDSMLLAARLITATHFTSFLRIVIAGKSGCTILIETTKLHIRSKRISEGYSRFLLQDHG